MRNFDQAGWSVAVAITISACGGGLKTTDADARDAASAPPDHGMSLPTSPSDSIGRDAGDDSPSARPDAARARTDAANPTTDGDVTRDAQLDGPIEVYSADGSLETDGAASRCPDALPLLCGDRLDHSTLVQGRANVWTGYGRSARAESGRETLYALKTSAACQVVARLKNLTVDLDLFLLTGCGPWSNTQASSTPLDLQTIETVSFATEAGQPYFVVVDGYAGAAGAYSLEVDCTCK